MAWKIVLVPAWTPDTGGEPPEIWGGSGQPMPPGAGGGGGQPPVGVWPGPGFPANPIAPGGGPSHPIAPGGEGPSHPIAPGGGPSHPIAPGGGEPSHPIAPGGEPPGIWGGGPPSYIDIGLPQPPVVWPNPPEGLPSFDPEQIPGHPELPDLDHGVWLWVNHDGAMVRCFAADIVHPGNDLPGHEPNEPPEVMQPGEWVVVLLDSQRPAWGWLPSAVFEATPH